MRNISGLQKVIIIGDSLSLPRAGLQYEETWFYLLQDNIKSAHFIPVLRRSLTTKVLVSEGGGDGPPAGADTLEYYMPSMVILHLGIVDCAPRLFTKLESSVISKLPSSIREIVIMLFKKIRKRSEKRSLVPPEQYEANIMAFADRCKKIGLKKLLLIEIVKPCGQMVESNPGILEAVSKYNSILKGIQSKFNFIETVVFDYQELSYFEDGYHLNQMGNRQLFDSLKLHLSELFT